MINENNISDIIDKIINASTEMCRTKEEAKEVLRRCGILDENYKIQPAYKDILGEIKPEQ